METKRKADIRDLFNPRNNDIYLYKSLTRPTRTKAERRGKVKIYTEEEIFLHQLREFGVMVSTQ